jgi:hypothetical protein
MNPTTTPPPAPMPPPAPAPLSRSRQHSTRRVIAAAVAGIALGVAGVSLLMPSPVDGARAAPPAVSDGATVDAGVATSPTGSESGVVDQAAAEQAALAYLGDGRVTWVSPEDDRGAVWEIEVTLSDGREVDVLVDATGAVIDARQGLARWLP